MTDKYKYGSISFRKNVLDNVRRLSTKILPKDGEKISSAKTFELGIKEHGGDLAISKGFKLKELHTVYV